MNAGPLRPLRHSQYRLLATALVLSLFSAGLWAVAVVWQVIRLGGGPAEVSLVSTALAVGLLVPALLGGVVADRVPQRRILIVVEAVKGIAFGAAATLALTGTLTIGHLIVVSIVQGVSDAFVYPAYSALVPALVPEHDLLAVNGLEGMLRPGVMSAAGPAVAGAVIGAASPGAAMALGALAGLAGVAVLLPLTATPVRRAPGDPSSGPQHPVRTALADMREGFAYMVATPWLLSTLLFATLLVLAIMGPLEVLVPFVVKDQAGGDPSDHALVLAGYGIGGAVGSLLISSGRLPRRYLTVMNLTWGLGCLPLVVMGAAHSIWLLVVCSIIVGGAFSAASVIWGTLLQRRVPPHLLGRVSSLDFFLSLALMPVSMALTGPVSVALGLGTTFLIAGLAPTVVAVVAIVAAKLPRDELAHPLDRPVAVEDTSAAPVTNAAV